MGFFPDFGFLLVDLTQLTHTLEHQVRAKNGALFGNLETLRSQKAKLEHAVERLIDSFAEGLMEKDQFASRMDRTKSRIADLDARIKTCASGVDRREHLRFATNRLRELAATVGPELGSADWQRRREIIRTVVQRIDIDCDLIKIIFRVNQNTHGSDSDAIAITFPRPSKTIQIFCRLTTLSPLRENLRSQIPLVVISSLRPSLDYLRGQEIITVFEKRPIPSHLRKLICRERVARRQE